MENPFTASRPGPRPGAIVGGFVGASAIVLACALPRFMWSLSAGMAPYSDSIPPPPEPRALLIAAALAFTLTVGWGAMLCLPFFRPRTRSAGAGMIAGWLVPTLLTAGSLTGLRPEQYEPMRHATAWSNDTTNTDTATLTSTMNTVLVGALSGAPGPVTSVNLAKPTEGLAEDHVRLEGGGSILVGRGKAADYRRELVAGMSDRYARVPAEDSRESRLKVRDDIMMQIRSSENDETVSILLTTQRLADPTTTTVQTMEPAGPTIRRVEAMAHAQGVRLHDLPETLATVPCPGSNADAKVYEEAPHVVYHEIEIVETTTFAMPRGRGTSIVQRMSRMEGGQWHPRGHALALSGDGLDIYFDHLWDGDPADMRTSAVGEYTSIFQACP